MSELWSFIQTGWTAVGFGEDWWGGRPLFPPPLCPWRRRCGWSGLGGVPGAAGRSAGSETTSSVSPPWSSRSRLPPLLPRRAGSGAAVGSGCPGGLWEIASRALRYCRCWCFRCLTRLPVRWPLPAPAGQRPAVGTGTGWLASRCSPEPQGPPPSLTATRGPPVNHSTNTGNIIVTWHLHRMYWFLIHYYFWLQFCTSVNYIIFNQ